MDIVMLELSKIILDPSITARVDRPAEKVAEYAQAMEDEASFPPVVCFNDGQHLYLVDGWIRYLAAKKLGRKAIAAEVRVGSRREMRLFASASNASHGLQRTLADRRLAVLITLEEQPSWTVPRVSAHCRVSPSLISAIIEVKRRMPAATPAEVAERGPQQMLGKPAPTPKPATKPAPKPAPKPTPPATANPWVGVLDARRRDEDDESEQEQDTPSVAAVADAFEFDAEAEEDIAHELEITYEQMMRAGRKWVRFATRLGLELHATLDEIIEDMKKKAEVARRRGRPEKVPAGAGELHAKPADE